MLLLLLCLFSYVQPCATPWKAAHQAPLSTRFSRQEYWSRFPFPSPETAIEHSKNISHKAELIVCGNILSKIFYNIIVNI